MKKSQKERLISMKDAVTELMLYIQNQKSGRMPRSYSLLDNMRNNIELFVLLSDEEGDVRMLDAILFRDWCAANEEWYEFTETGKWGKDLFRDFLGLLEQIEEYFP